MGSQLFAALDRVDTIRKDCQILLGGEEGKMRAGQVAVVGCHSAYNIALTSWLRLPSRWRRAIAKSIDGANMSSGSSSVKAIWKYRQS